MKAVRQIHGSMFFPVKEIKCTNFLFNNCLQSNFFFNAVRNIKKYLLNQSNTNINQFAGRYRCRNNTQFGHDSDRITIGKTCLVPKDIFFSFFPTRTKAIFISTTQYRGLRWAQIPTYVIVGVNCRFPLKMRSKNVYDIYTDSFAPLEWPPTF